MAGAITNHDVVVFSNGEITRLLARRLLSTLVMVGAPLLEMYMADAPAVFAQPALHPSGTIGKLKAIEIGAYGDWDHGQWLLKTREFPGACGAVLANDIEKLRVQRVCTEGTSVYIQQ
jgi:hypothetical protein